MADGGLPARINLITLGVSDVARARAFYERLGFVASGFESEDIAFFDLNGTALAVFGRDALAEDATVPAEGDGFRAVALAINLETPAAVDSALAFAAEQGGTIVKPACEVFWGGYSGYFADPDGHLWEVAYNPVFALDENGRITFPPPNSPSPQ